MREKGRRDDAVMFGISIILARAESGSAQSQLRRKENE